MLPEWIDGFLTGVVWMGMVGGGVIWIIERKWERVAVGVVEKVEGRKG